MSPVMITRRAALAASRVSAPVITNVLSLDGTAANWASTPDSVANSITGAIDVRIRLSLDDWTPGVATTALVSKWPTSGTTNRSWAFAVSTDPPQGGLMIFYSTTGSNFLSAVSSVATGFTDGSVHWVRFTKSGTECKFYTSEDGTSWSQLGTTQTVTSGQADTTALVYVGGTNNVGSLDGKVYYAEIRNGIDGSVVAEFDPTSVVKLGTRNPTTYVADTGETWTMAGSAWDWVAP